MKKFEFNTANKKKYQELLTHYDDIQSALMPVLHLAQEQHSWLSPEVVAHISELMGIPEIKINEVISFYDMFYDHPTARNVVQVCTNITCSMFGGREIHKGILDYFQLHNMKPSQDGKLYIQKMECLGACEMAPCMRINNIYEGHLTLKTAVQKLEVLP